MSEEVVVEKKGIKETKEMLIGSNELTLFMMSRLMDGIDYKDFGAFYDKLTKDDEFQKVLREAWEGKQKISGEMKDVDLSEGMELVNIQVGYIPKYVELMKKESEKDNENKEGNGG